MLVNITEDEYEICREASLKYWASSKPGKYGKGLANTKDDNKKVERSGMLGEMAFHKVSGLPYDFSFKRGGDKYDFLLPDGRKIDIKTAASNYGGNCIKSYTPGMRYIFNESKIYVGGYVVEDNGKTAIVNLMGYEFGSVIKTFPVKDARRKDQFHKNFELVHAELRDLKELLALCPAGVA